MRRCCCAFLRISFLRFSNDRSTSGLGAIVSRIAAARSNQGDVRLASAGDSIDNLLELTHLNKILNSYKDVEQAIISYRENE